MNANELADELEACFTKADWNVLEAATMLRQQQAEIEALKLSLSGHSAEILSKNDETLPNGKCEPVAWRNLLVDEEDPNGTWFYNEVGQGIPLYTHPVKELLAKDILDVYQSREWYEDFDGELWFNWLKFADAILRKAQEK